MNSLNFLLDVAKIALGGIIVFFAAWMYIKVYLDKRFNFKLLQLKKKGLRHTLPLRLQAYERMVLFLERIDPSNLLVRLHQPGLDARSMQNLVIAEIRAEYQHNITQQLYVSEATWEVVKKIKNDTLNMIANTVNTLPADASAVDLSRLILTHLAGLETENPYELALSIVKREAAALF